MADEIPKLELPVKLTIIECCNCGIPFGIPDYFQEKRKLDHRTFTCPNQHEQLYNGFNDKDQVKKLTAALERISNIEISSIFNKNSLELAIEIAKNALK